MFSRSRMIEKKLHKLRQKFPHARNPSVATKIEKLEAEYESMREWVTCPFCDENSTDRKDMAKPCIDCLEVEEDATDA